MHNLISDERYNQNCVFTDKTVYGKLNTGILVDVTDKKLHIFLYNFFYYYLNHFLYNI